MTTMTIKEAMETLRQVIPANERSIFIKAEFKDYNHYAEGDELRCRVVFGVWDERETHEGPTLRIAVEKCLLGNTKEPSTVADIDAVTLELENREPTTTG